MATDLTSVANVKEYLGLDAGNSKDDVLLSRLVSAASALFISSTGVDFPSASRTDTVDGDGTSVLLLEHIPVTAIASVTVDGSAVSARATVDGDGYILTDGAIGKLELVGSYFTKGKDNVVVTYTAGEAAPADVEQAIIARVAWAYKSKDRIGLSARQLPGAELLQYTTSYETGNAEFEAVCKLYRRPSFG